MNELEKVYSFVDVENDGKEAFKINFNELVPYIFLLILLQRLQRY
jgi:hypothetical protein